MKGTLVKREDRYDLYNESDGSKIASSAPNPFGKLSITNCELIVNGYNVNELADKYYGPGDYGLEIKTGFIKGFKVAMRLTGDKKFSEKELKFNMLQLFYLEKNKGEEEAIFRERQLSFIEKSIQSLQQTEFDVEIVTKPFIEVSEGFNLEQKREPKLDAENCLILKRL